MRHEPKALSSLTPHNRTRAPSLCPFPSDDINAMFISGEPIPESFLQLGPSVHENEAGMDEYLRLRAEAYRRFMEERSKVCLRLCVNEFIGRVSSVRVVCLCAGVLVCASS